MSWREISVAQLETLTDPLLVDVRSPGEHVSECIPNSINIPLLSDQERVVVGTIYKEQGEMIARREALRLIAPKISPIVENIVLRRKNRQSLVVHCWRGGLRSEAVASVLSIAGIDCWRLTGGYKAWRNYVLAQLKESKLRLNPFVLDGLTGVGKTDILSELYSLGASVLDLESLAGHRGSVFGSLGLGPQPTQKNFEGLLWTQLKTFREDPLFLEAESRRIGKIELPDCILKTLQQGRKILVTASLPARRSRIMRAYLNKFDGQALLLASKSLDKLKERLGAKRTAELFELARAENFEKLVDILLVEYYDPLYLRQIEINRPYDYEVCGDNVRVAAAQIFDRYCLKKLPAQLGRS